jgi:hypothetical protein
MSKLAVATLAMLSVASAVTTHPREKSTCSEFIIDVNAIVSLHCVVR